MPSWLAPGALALAMTLGCGGKGDHYSQPTLAGYTPVAGQASTLVAVYGTGLGQNINSVTLGGEGIPTTSLLIGALSYSPDPVTGNTSVSFPVPLDAVTGPIVITTPGGAITTPDFIVIPVVTSVSPASGSLAAGTAVTFAGSGLMGITSVKFGGAVATPVSRTPNQIVVNLPAGAPQGAIQVTFVVEPAYGLPNPEVPFTVNP